jgi:molybdate transport system substrate-binding protein
VDAASSLSTVLPRLATAFKAEHPTTSVRFSFGGSSDLAAAIVAGAPVDVLAAASTKTMATVTDAHLAAGRPVAIARNKLQIVVPRDNPGRITSLKDFGDSGRTIVICAPAVPCGAAAQRVFALAHIAAKPDSLEQSVSGVLAKVRLGEADAGLVYLTDVRAAGDTVIGLPFPEANGAITDVVIAPLKHSANPALARAFTVYVEQHGRNVLDAAGFLAPKR